MATKRYLVSFPQPHKGRKDGLPFVLSSRSVRLLREKGYRVALAPDQFEPPEIVLHKRSTLT